MNLQNFNCLKTFFATHIILVDGLYVVNINEELFEFQDKSQLNYREVNLNDIDVLQPIDWKINCIEELVEQEEEYK